MRAVSEAYAAKIALIQKLYGEVYATAFKKAYEEAYEEAYAEGFERGYAEGYAEGRELAKKEVAHNALEIGLSIDMIIQLTGLSEKEIHAVEANAWEK